MEVLEFKNKDITWLLLFILLFDNSLSTDGKFIEQPTGGFTVTNKIAILFINTQHHPYYKL